MTINVPIRSGAALADPETRQFVEENILHATYSMSERSRKLPDLAYNQEGIVNILANYPWREYGYKKGRWARVMFYDPFIRFRTWEKIYQGLALTDPANGREIAEVDGAVCPGEEPSGRLLFAGDPHYAGVLNVVARGKQWMCIVGSIRLINNPQIESSNHRAFAIPTLSARARDVAKTMVPGYAPQVRLYDPPEKYLKYLGPWVADDPEKPARRRG
jgi:hypothetical protein